MGRIIDRLKKKTNKGNVKQVAKGDGSITQVANAPRGKVKQKAKSNGGNITQVGGSSSS
jgi:hypothetical protein